MIGLIASLALFQVKLEPCVLESYPNPERMWEYQLSLVDELDLSLPDSQMKFLSIEPGVSKQRVGSVRFYNPATRRIHFAQFNTVDDEEGFLRKLSSPGEGYEFEREHHGDVIYLHGTFKKGLVRVPFHMAYEDGLCVSGTTAAIALLNPDKIRKLVKQTTGDDHTYRIQFSAVPESHRAELFKEVRAKAFAFQQRRDSETADDYGIRRALGDAKLGLMRIASRDIDEIRFRVRSPGPTKGGFDARLSVNCVKGSDLARQVSELAVRHPSISIINPNALVGWAELHVGVPRDLTTTFSKVRGQEDRLLGSLMGAAATGRVEAAVGVKASESTLHAFGAMGISSEKLPIKGLPEPKHTLNDQCRWSLDSLTGYAELAALELLAGIQAKNIWFDISPNTPQVSIAQFDFEATRLPRPILGFEFDFSKWNGRLDDGAHSHKVLRSLEDLCDSIFLAVRAREQEENIAKIRDAFLEATKRLPATKRQRLLERTVNRERTSHKTRLPDRLINPSQSILKHTDTDGDWAASGEVRAVGGAIKAKLHIGRELHKLYVGRTLLAAKRIAVFRSSESGAQRDGK